MIEIIKRYLRDRKLKAILRELNHLADIGRKLHAQEKTLLRRANELRLRELNSRVRSRAARGW